MEPLIVLVHSPLVGPFTWGAVAEALRAAGHDVLVPTLADGGATPPAYWQQHAESFGRALAAVPPERPLVLSGHSGAGPLLPLLAHAAARPVAAYLFVDAALPHPGESQMDEMESAVPEFAGALRAQLAAGARYPDWSDADLREELPDAAARARVLAEMRPRGLGYFAEVPPAMPNWPDPRSGYLLFSEGYRPALEQARASGWPSRVLPGGHFHLLVDPAGVAGALVGLVAEIEAATQP